MATPTLAVPDPTHAIKNSSLQVLTMARLLRLGPYVLLTTQLVEVRIEVGT